MANFFQDLIKKVMPDELEYKLGITPQPKAMEFRVGEGLTAEQKVIAEKKVKTLAKEAPPPQENFFAGLLRSVPRSIAATTLKVAGKPGEVFEPAYGKGITPTVQKFIFGEEAVKRPEGVLETGLEAIGAIPFLPGGILKQPAKAVVKKGVEEVIEPLAKRIISKIPQPVLVKDFIKNSDIIGKTNKQIESFLKIRPDESLQQRLTQRISANENNLIKLELERRAKVIIPQELQPLAREARKYKSAEEFVEAKIGNKQPVFHGTTEIIEGDFKYPLYLTKDKIYAEHYATNKSASSITTYAKKGGGEKVYEFYPKDPKRVLDIRKSKHAQAIENYWRESVSGQQVPTKTGLPDWTEGESLAQFIKENKLPFDSILVDEGGIQDFFTQKIKHRGVGFVAINKEAILTKSQLTDFYNQAVKGVKEIAGEAPKITPENTIQKLIQAIDKAVPLRGEQQKLYSKALAQRTARVASVGEKVGGEKGFFAQLGQLKGQLPKVQFEAIKKQFGQKEIDLLFDTIEQTKTLLPLEKVSTKGGLMKLFEGAVPTKSEIELLKEVFPKELIDAVLARRPFIEKLGGVIGEVINIPRTMMATLDLSAPLRQGIFMIGRPVRFAEAFKDMFKFAVSEKAYQGLMEGIKARPTYLKMRQGGLALTEIGGAITKREEAFMGSWAEKIPGYGVLVRASNRAYTGFLNKLRADVFDDILAKAKAVGRDTDDALLKSAAEFVNSGTGRGKFGLAKTGVIPQSMEKAATVLNGVFFSPRLMASRLNLLNPYFYIQLDPLVRKEAIKTLFATTGILGTIGGLWKLNGGEIGVDPRSADFGKMKVGNTRYDILGGFQQYLRLASQLITGEIVSSTTGRTITLGEGYKPLTRQEIALRFFENKTSPIASFILGLLKGQTATGEDIDVPTEIVNRFIPMVVQDIYDLSQEKGAENIFMGLPAIFGAGVQTYGKQELAFGESRLGEPTAQIRPVPELAEKIRELVLGQLPLGSSKSYSVEAYFDQLSNMPREEAKDIFDKIAKTNPELAKKLYNVVKERELGITVKDKDLKAKGVASGDRALAIKKELDKLKTKEEKAALWSDYVRKGIITKDVSRQLMKMLKD